MVVKSASPALQLGPDRLTASERVIFDFFYSALGNWVTPAEVTRHTIGEPNSGLKTHISHMRSKLAGSDWEIQSRHLAYRMVKKTA
jgi:hypothetical protein